MVDDKNYEVIRLYIITKVHIPEVRHQGNCSLQRDAASEGKFNLSGSYTASHVTAM